MFGIFKSILAKVGLASAETPVPATEAPVATEVAAEIAPAAGEPQPEPEPEPTPAEPVDIVALMDAKAKDSKEKGLDWRKSIVDLLKLLDMDSSLNARRELAKELGYTASTEAAHSAEMNVWLIKEVLKQIAKNGGSLPGNLTD